MTITVKHAHQTALPNDGSKDVSATAWNEAHTVVGLATVAETGAYSDLIGAPTVTGTNTGDQTSIVGITGTKAQFDTACSDGNFAYQSDLASYVVGPASSVDNELTRFDSTTGKLIQGGSGATLSDAGVLSLPAGASNAPSYIFGTDTTTGWYRSGGNVWAFTASNTAQLTLNQGTTRFVSSMKLGWSSGAPTAASDTSIERDSAGVLQINSGATGTLRDLKLRNLLAGGGNGSYIQTPSMTVANLAAAGTAGAGARAFVTDATATTFLSTVAGGGANKVPVVSDGTNWLIG